MQAIGKINDKEKVVLDHLIKLGAMLLPDDWDRNLFVQQMDDGGMGSFLIFQNTSDIGTIRKFGKQASEFEFIDNDGIVVLVSLNLDIQNRFYEVDIWKTNNEPVINLKIQE